LADDPNRYPLKAEVEGFNNEEIAKLPGHEFRYESVDSGGFDPYHEPVPDSGVRQLLERMIAVSSLTLKACFFHGPKLLALLAVPCRWELKSC
jgi:hypothetical protein